MTERQGGVRTWRCLAACLVALCAACTPEEQPTPSATTESPQDDRDSGSAVTGDSILGPRPILALPCDVEDVRYEVYGLWPFGIHGGGHPEGHGGWDFELDASSIIRSPMKGVVEERRGDPEFPDRISLGIRTEDGAMRVQIGHLIHTRSALVEGFVVEQGEALGMPASADGGRFHMIHFAVSWQGSDQPYGEMCPLDWLTDTARDEVEGIMEKAVRDPFEWELCNPRVFADPDPFVGVWFASGSRPDYVPAILTLTPFELDLGRRVAASNAERLTTYGSYEVRGDLSVLVTLEDGSTFIGRLVGDQLAFEIQDRRSGRTVLVTYRRNAFE